MTIFPNIMTSNPKNTNTNIAEVLAWNSFDVTSLVTKQVCRNHLEYRVSALNKLRTDNDKIENVIISKINRLDDAEFMRIINSPRMNFFLQQSLSGRQEWLTEFLLQSYSAENSRKCGTLPKHPCWSALGDFFSTSDRIEYNPKGLFGEIFLDDRSPFGHNPIKNAAPKDFTATYRVNRPSFDVTKKVNSALVAMAKTNPLAFDFCRSVLQTVLLRKMSQRDFGYTSVSARPFVGRATLVNAESNKVDSARLCSSIIHESVHNYLYRIEQFGYFVSNLDQGINTTVLSPWTGNPIRLLTYIHACFVYFALTKFWQYKSAQDNFGGKPTILQLNFSTRGFEEKLYLKRLEIHASHIDPAIYEQLERLYASI